MENHDATPGVFKLYSRSVIYSVNFSELLAFYGIGVRAITKTQMGLIVSSTRLLKPEVYDASRPVSPPLRSAFTRLRLTAQILVSTVVRNPRRDLVDQCFTARPSCCFDPELECNGTQVVIGIVFLIAQVALNLIGRHGLK